IRAGAAVDVALDFVIRAENALRAEDLVGVRFLDRALEHLGLAMVFTSYIDVSDVALRRDRADGDAFEQLVRVVIDEIPVLERPGLGLIGVDGEVVRALLLFGDERPFLTGRETRPAAPAQAGIGDGFDDLFAFHLQGFTQRSVAAGGDVGVVPDRLALAGVLRNSFGENGFGEGHSRYFFSSCLMIN